MKKILLVLFILAAMMSTVSAASLSLSLNSLEAISEGDTVTLTATVTAVGDSVGDTSLQLGALPVGTATSDSLVQSVGTLSSGQSSSKSWTIRGDVAGNYTFNVTASGTGVNDTFQNASLLVNTAAFIEVSDKTCSATTVNVDGTITMNFIVKNTGGSPATVAINMSGYSGKLTLSSGSASSSFTLDAGSQSSKSYVFTGSSAGTATITAGVTSTKNDPTDPTCAVTVPGTSTTTTSTTTTSGTQIVLTKTVTQELSAEELSTLLSEIGATQSEITAATSFTGKATIETYLEVKKITSTSYVSTITITITNPSKDKTLTDIVLVVEIPKGIAQTASYLNIPSTLSYSVAKEDPVLKFEISEIGAEESATISYSVNKQVSSAVADSIQNAVILSLIEVKDLCAGKNCDDNNPCTTDKCSGGNCSYTNITDGSSCGTGKICKSGACTASTTDTNKTTGPGTDGIATPLGEINWTMITIILVIILVIIVIAAFYISIKAKPKLGN